MANEMNKADQDKIKQAKRLLLYRVLPQLEQMASSGVWGCQFDPDKLFDIIENEHEISISLFYEIKGVFRRQYYIRTDIECLNDDGYYICGYNFYIDTQDRWIIGYLEKHNKEYEAQIVNTISKLWDFVYHCSTEDDDMEDCFTQNTDGHIDIAVYDPKILSEVFSSFFTISLVSHGAVPMVIPNRPLSEEDKALRNKLNEMMPDIGLEIVDDEIKALNKKIGVMLTGYYIAGNNNSQYKP